MYRVKIRKLNEERETFNASVMKIKHTELVIMSKLRTWNEREVFSKVPV